ncbi:MAG: thrombospondin type 3 repeat-containing protein, partial [Flavobacteriales bacterium]
MKRFLLLLSVLLTCAVAFSQSYSERDAVELAATVQKNPARITISWESYPGATNYTIYRKLKDAQSWGSSIGSVGGSVNQFADNNVGVGTYYEYKVVRTAGNVGTGYVASGIELAAVENRGKMVLLVDNDIKNGLTTELAQLQADLENDGWTVIRHDVSRSASVTSIRSTIQSDYNADPTRVKAVYIVGHVPVPYSGNLNPDGHSDHKGAWPADGYYGDMDGNWTDNSVNTTSAQLDRNYNKPGDGRFDQSDYPSDIELQVGRIDFYNIGTPWYAFPTSELELTRTYLNKAHNYKIRQLVPLRRGIVFDNFQDLSNPVGASGYRNVSALVGAANTTNANAFGAPFYTLVNNQSYLWTYASGGGTWVSAYNVGTTDDYAAISNGGIFNMSFGSYFGDWDMTNGFMKSIVASGNALTCVWAGIPNWWFQNMGMGDNIGYSTRLTMNNVNLYTPQNGGWQGQPYDRVHLALLGDPSLRMTVVPRPSNFQAVNAGGLTNFTWTAALGPVDGYHVYEVQANGNLNRITNNVVTQTNYSDPAVPFVAGKKYMLRAVKLQTSNTGTYFDLSLGVQATSAGTATADCNGVVGGSAVPGSSCNDGDPCTVNDVYNASCQCLGSPSPDSDGDGVCNSQDNCPNVPGQIGSSCNDGNANTINDVLNSNCQCVGTPVNIDCNGVPGGSALPGTACNDGNANTTNDVLNSNCQCVGTPVSVDCNNVPNGPAMPGSSCNDGNPCTINDVLQANCQCAGTPAPDSDGDGVCNSQDNCPNVAGQIGSACNDGNANTINDVLNSNCQCVGTAVTLDCNSVPNGPAMPGSSCNDGNPCTINDVLQADCQCAGSPAPDNDGDGVCNSQDNCPNVPGQIGSSCNDGNPCTINDVLNSNCQCAGTPAPDSDGDGVCNSQDNCPNVPGQIGAACDDSNAGTINDELNSNCQCVGTIPPPVDCQGVTNGPAMPGTACNDNNPNTGNDHWNANCNCVGQPLDCNGIPNGSALPGTACDDGNAGTINDVFNTSCTCEGTVPVVLDCNSVPNGPAMPGTPCNDGNACTMNDVLNNDCVCEGTPSPDSDGDGICNSQDNCPNVPGQIGSSCNDGDPCTINDVLNSNCQCAGSPAPDNDGDGLCNSQDNCPNVPGQIGSSCNDGNAATINDILNSNCQCVGTVPPPVDCQGVTNGPAMPGTPCNDNNPATGNDHWNANCNCVGQVIDCNGVPGGNALPGTACNDGNAGTINDEYGTDCVCAGIIPPTLDCQGVPNGPAMPGTPCNDNNPATGNDHWNANCNCVGQVID